MLIGGVVDFGEALRIGEPFPKLLAGVECCDAILLFN